MTYVALASDYDGTLAHDGQVDQATIAALEKFRKSGRKLILVTGRILADLESVFSHFDLFDSIVAENGAVVFNPATRERQVLAASPEPALVDRPGHFVTSNRSLTVAARLQHGPSRRAASVSERFRFDGDTPLVEKLKQLGVEPIEAGDVIIATHVAHRARVIEAIRELGLELQVILNKDSVMVLPMEIDKKSGLASALDALGVSERNVVGIGDAENDPAFLKYCGCGVAVANALPAVKETADFTTSGDHGAGVVELIELILTGELEQRYTAPA